MTAKVTRASGQYFSVPDSSNLTFPDADWTIGGLLILDGLTSGDNGQYLFSTGGYQASGSLNVLYQTAGNGAQPSTLCFTRNTDAGVRASTSKFVAGDALIWALHHSNGLLTMRTAKVRNTAPTDGSSVVLESSDQPLTVALDGPAGLIFGGRGDLASNRFADQSIGRFFYIAGLLSDFELAKLSYGMEITDLGKTPLWYFRMDTASDISDRGSLGLTMTPRGNGTIATGTAPAFGYTGASTPTPTPSTPTINGTPMTAERIYQRAGTALAIAMSGLWTVTKPDSIEYQLLAEDRITVLMPWAAITNATINADGTWSGTPTVPQGGMYYRQVRAKAGGAVVATGDIETNLFGVGDLWLHDGSSSSAFYFTSDSGTGYTPAANVRVYHNSNTTWAKFSGTGCAILMANILAAKAGVPIGFIAYGWGGTQLAQWLDKSGTRWTTTSAAVLANGGKLAGAIITVGSNDANDGIVKDRATHTANVRQFITNHRDLTGQPNLPIVWVGFNRRPSANAQQSDWVRQSENIVGDDPNVYHVQTLDFELRSDLIHQSVAAFANGANRTGTVAGDAVYKGVYRRGPKINAISYLGSKVYFDLLYRNNGSDFTPTSGINGLSLVDASGALSFTTARDTGGRLTATCTRDVVPPLSAKYLSGSSPVSSSTAAPTNEVFDNGAMSLPMTVETEMASTAVTATSTVTADFAQSWTIQNQSTVSADFSQSWSITGLTTSTVSVDFVQSWAILAGVVTSFTASKARTIKVKAASGKFEGGEFWNLSNAKKPVGTLDTDSTVDVTLDWSEVMLDTKDAIAACDFVPTGLTAVSAKVDPDTSMTTIFVRPTFKAPCSFTCRVTTASTPPRVYDRSVYFAVEDQ